MSDTLIHPATGEPSNEQRAIWALLGLEAFATETYCGQTFPETVSEQPDVGDDAYTMVQDLISNLLHLAHQHDWDTDELLRRAQSMFADELAMEAAD